MSEVDRGDLVDAAYALLMAAILLRDMSSAMAPLVLGAMPMDLRNRMIMTIYQDAFNRLPQDIQAEARSLVMANPDVQRARALGGVEK